MKAISATERQNLRRWTAGCVVPFNSGLSSRAVVPSLRFAFSLAQLTPLEDWLRPKAVSSSTERSRLDRSCRGDLGNGRRRRREGPPSLSLFCHSDRSDSEHRARLREREAISGWRARELSDALKSGQQGRCVPCHVRAPLLS